MSSTVAEVRAAAAAWAMGELADPVATLCALVVRRSGTCALIEHDGDTRIAGSFAPAHEAVVRRVAAVTASERAFVSQADERWATLVAAVGESGVVWVACEPVGAHEASATLVVLGVEEGTIDETLTVLPTLSRALAPVVAQRYLAYAAGRVVHQLNNELASLIANIEFATDLAAPPSEPSTPHQSELATALLNAQSSARRLHTQARSLRALVESGAAAGRSVFVGRSRA